MPPFHEAEMPPRHQRRSHLRVRKPDQSPDTRTLLPWWRRRAYVLPRGGAGNAAFRGPANGRSPPRRADYECVLTSLIEADLFYRVLFAVRVPDSNRRERRAGHPDGRVQKESQPGCRLLVHSKKCAAFERPLLGCMVGSQQANSSAATSRRYGNSRAGSNVCKNAGNVSPYFNKTGLRGGVSHYVDSGHRAEELISHNSAHRRKRVLQNIYQSRNHVVSVDSKSPYSGGFSGAGKVRLERDPPETQARAQTPADYCRAGRTAYS